MRTSDPCRSRGFSLVEVVVTLVIVMILIPLSVPVYEKFARDIDEEALQQRLLEMRRAVRQFYQDHKRFPYFYEDHFGNSVYILANDQSELVTGVHDGPNGHFPRGRRRYLSEIPVDPITGIADWKPIPYHPQLTDELVSRQPLPTETSTRQLFSVNRGLVASGTARLENLHPVVRTQVMDFKSQSPGYESY